MSKKMIFIPSIPLRIAYENLNEETIQKQLKKLYLSNQSPTIYCTCNGSDSNKWIKMFIRKNINKNNQETYTLVTNVTNKYKHTQKCMRTQNFPSPTKPFKNEEKEDFIKNIEPLTFDTLFLEETFTLNFFDKTNKKYYFTNKKQEKIHQYLLEKLLLEIHYQYLLKGNTLPRKNFIYWNEIYNFYYTNSYPSLTLQIPLNASYIKEALYINDLILNPRYLKKEETLKDLAIRQFNYLQSYSLSEEIELYPYIIFKLDQFHEINESQMLLSLSVPSREKHKLLIDFLIHKKRFNYLYEKIKFKNVDYLIAATFTLNDQNQLEISNLFSIIPTFKNTLIPIKDAFSEQLLLQLFTTKRPSSS